ncbi:tetratricopeptide repeat protein [Humitalea rosea]|nr:tetratricopeptide repeat protein [Humitalea rosea]
MMLRELVVNALEAATSATDTAPFVQISSSRIGGTPKLSIWNTGRGLSPEELLQMSDLSSSLFKTQALDGNFGMGAKVASLSSNKLGLRYRSCRHGLVAQIILGQRGGVYGRLLQAAAEGEAAEVLDVTEECRAEGRRRLDHDWTEVVLLGNAEEQNTILSPYGDDPAVPRDWLMQALSRRFFRLPRGVTLQVDRAVAGSPQTVLFDPPLGAKQFDRFERVPVEEGIVIHYCYRGTASPPLSLPVNPVGLGAVLSNGEVYAMVEGRRWALESPAYGFTFASRLCTVLVELPPDFGVRPEVYRQFLRFRDGDQRQVQFGDFGDLVRMNIPPWLKSIIGALQPDSEDYLLEIKADLQQLMLQLGVADLVPQIRGLRGARNEPKPDDAKPEVAKPDEAKAAPAAKPPAPRPPAPPRLNLPTPPEIITVEDDDELAERGLAGRAARYYQLSRQMFVNIRYAAFARLAAELATEFGAAADTGTIDQLSHHVAEWTLIRRLTRAVIFGLGKPKLGWTREELAGVQTPEALSLMVDDYELLLPAARQRMARLLGIEPAGGYGAAGIGDINPQAVAAERIAADRAEAEAALQRAKAANVGKLAPFYLRLASIDSRRGDLVAAEAMLSLALADDPENYRAHLDLAKLQMTKGDFGRAATSAEAALARTTPVSRTSALRMLVRIESRRGNIAVANGLLREAIAATPDDPWLYFDLAGLRLEEGALAEAGEAAEAAIARNTSTFPHFHIQLSTIEARRNNPGRAVEMAEQAIAFAPEDPGPHLHLAGLRMAQGDLGAAAEAARIGHSLTTVAPGGVLRRRAHIETRRKDFAAAQQLLVQALSVDPDDATTLFDLAGARLAMNDLDGAAEACEAALERSSGPSRITYLLRLSGIETRRRNIDAAQRALQEAIVSAPENPWPHYELAGLRIGEGDLEGAAEAAEAAIARGVGNTSRLLRRLSTIEARRGNPARAGALLEQVLADWPEDVGTYLDLSHLRITEGRLDEAAAAIEGAIACSPVPDAALLRRRGHIESRRRDFAAARGWLDQALALDPLDPRTHTDLSNLFMAMGDLDAARAAAARAVELARGDSPAAMPKPAEAA